MLEVEQISKHYGGIAAVADVSLRVDDGEIRCLVGPNGAGKTTLFNMLAGSTKPSSGSIRLRGRDVTGLSPRRMSRLGVARKYQSPSVFDEFTVRDNLRIALDGKRTVRQLLRHDHQGPTTASRPLQPNSALPTNSAPRPGTSRTVNASGSKSA